MNPAIQVYVNGQFHSRETAAVSVFDHGLLYGDGIFEGIRVYSGRIFKLQDHLGRLYRSAAAILLTVPLDIEEMATAVKSAVRENRLEDGYVRVVVTRGVGDLGIDPGTCERSTLIIIADTISLYPAERYSSGIGIVSVSTRRNAVDALDPRIKSLNYLNNILAKIQARQAGCLEAVMLDPSGAVAECTGDNIFIVREKRVCTPALTHGALDGITRAIVLGLAADLGYPTEEATLSCYDLYTADECFLTGTGAEIMPVVEVDGRVVGRGVPGEATAEIARAFMELVRARGAPA